MGLAFDDGDAAVEPAGQQSVLRRPDQWPQAPGPPPMMMEDSMSRGLDRQASTSWNTRATRSTTARRRLLTSADLRRWRRVRCCWDRRGISAVRRQGREWMKEGPRLDLGLVGRAHERQASVGRHLHAGHPHHGLVLSAWPVESARPEYPRGLW
jgi:hypothetical protein